MGIMRKSKIKRKNSKNIIKLSKFKKNRGGNPQGINLQARMPNEHGAVTSEYESFKNNKGKTHWKKKESKINTRNSKSNNLQKKESNPNNNVNLSSTNMGKILGSNPNNNKSIVSIRSNLNARNSKSNKNSNLQKKESNPNNNVNLSSTHMGKILGSNPNNNNNNNKSIFPIGSNLNVRNSKSNKNHSNSNNNNISYLSNIFNIIDINKDGFISKIELYKAVKNKEIRKFLNISDMSNKLSEKSWNNIRHNIDPMFQKINVNGDNLISKEEFI